MATRPRPADAPLIAESVHNAADWIGAFAEAVLAAHREPDAGGGGLALRRGTDVADPTGNAAVAGGEGGWLGAEQARLVDELAHLVEVAGAVVSRIDNTRRRLWPDGTRPDLDEESKCRQGCGDDAASGEQGNCRRCGQWLRDNRYPDGTKRAQVSSEYLAKRRAADERRRVHVTGPLADDEAVA